MTLVLIEVPNEAAVEHLRQQPGVRVVRVVGRPDGGVRKPSIASLVGSLSDETAEQMRLETSKLHSEWEREF